MSDPARLLLADGRFPSGGHVHSAGIEAAVADGRVTGITSLEAYLVGRLWTVGLSDAALVAAGVDRLVGAGGSAAPDDRGPVEDRPAVAPRRAVPAPDVAAPEPLTSDGSSADAVLAELDAEAGARLAVPALRAASRRQGRQLVRVAARCWPSRVLARLGSGRPADQPSWRGEPHLVVAWAAVAVAAGVDVDDAAGLVVHHALTTPAQAALRLLGLDPFAVAALTVRLGPVAEAVVGAAADQARSLLADLPARSGPVAEVAAEEHAGWEVRLFAT